MQIIAMNGYSAPNLYNGERIHVIQFERTKDGRTILEIDTGNGPLNRIELNPMVSDELGDEIRRNGGRT